jgi:hypothetical protein
MAAGLVIPISGPYVGTWQALPLGTLSDDGYEVSCTLQGQEVNETDAYGMTLVEGIWRGQNWRCRLRGLEWKTGLLSILQMFGQTGAAGSLTPILANIGDRWTKYCQSLVLTAILGNPPTTPQTLTAVNAGFAPNTQSQFLKTSKVRELPLELVLIPYQTVIASVTYSLPFTTT